MVVAKCLLDITGNDIGCFKHYCQRPNHHYYADDRPIRKCDKALFWDTANNKRPNYHPDKCLKRPTKNPYCAYIKLIDQTRFHSYFFRFTVRASECIRRARRQSAYLSLRRQTHARSGSRSCSHHWRGPSAQAATQNVNLCIRKRLPPTYIVHASTCFNSLSARADARANKRSARHRLSAHRNTTDMCCRCPLRRIRG